MVMVNFTQEELKAARGHLESIAPHDDEYHPDYDVVASVVEKMKRAQWRDE